MHITTTEQQFNIPSCPKKMSSSPQQNLILSFFPSKTIQSFKEIGDGNLNFVYLCTFEDETQVILKQSVPFVKIIPSWPLSAKRIVFEANAMKIQNEFAPTYVPKLLFESEKDFSVIVEYLKPPFDVVRTQMINQIEIGNDFGVKVADFIETMASATSPEQMPSERRRQLIAQFSMNYEMCCITEKVIFIEPLQVDVAHNRHNAKLDDLVANIRKDELIARKAKQLLDKFRCNHEMLCHGDLHTGSIMANAETGDIKIIDSEFAFFGPIAFDIGMFLANLIMSFFAHQGNAYSSYIFNQIKCFWMNISNDHMQDAIDFCAIEMLRRTVGVAHVQDVDKIEDETIKTKVEENILNFIVNAFHRRNLDDFEFLCSPSLQTT